MQSSVAPLAETGEPPDASLIERSFDEPEHFADVFDRHARTIHRYVARRLGAALADDVVAETFLIAFRQRKRYDLARVDARPWLYGIASNQVHRQRRTEVRMYTALSRTGVDPVTESYAERVEDSVTAQSVNRELATALGGLSARDRDVLLLFAWADLSYDEIAVALGIPVGTVRSRLHRARRKLRVALGGSDPSATREEMSSNE